MTKTACGGGQEINIAVRDGSTAKPLIPPLRATRLITTHGNKMLFVGIEPDGAVGFEQEWGGQVIGAK